MKNYNVLACLCKWFSSDNHETKEVGIKSILPISNRVIK